jgi:hypothetical protein
METQQNALNKEIDILAVIDTTYVKINYPLQSKDPENPIEVDKKCLYIIVPSINQIAGPDVSFKARLWNHILFRGISISQNSDDAVIIYNINYGSGKRIFHNFIYEGITREHAVIPDPSSSNGLPADTATITFSSLDTKVKGRGTGNIDIYFALYTIDPEDSNNQILHSYYSCSSAITIK